MTTKEKAMNSMENIKEKIMTIINNIKPALQSRLAIIIALVISIVLSFISIIIYKSVEKHKGLPTTNKIIGILITSSIMIGILAGGIYHAITFKPDIINDEYSQNRMDSINEVLNSQFGPKWPIVYGIFIIFLIIILSQLYKITSPDLDVTLNDQNYKLFIKYLLGACITFTIVIIVQSIMAIKKMNKEKQALIKQHGDYYPSSSSSNISDMTKLVGLGLVTFSVVGILVFIIVKQTKKQKL